MALNFFPSKINKIGVDFLVKFAARLIYITAYIGLKYALCPQQGVNNWVDSSMQCLFNDNSDYLLETMGIKTLSGG
jgi:hypothetical protein